MHKSSYFPLRTILGDAIPVEKNTNVRQIFQSQESRNFNIQYDIALKNSISDTFTDSHYYNFLPIFDLNGTTFYPGEGMNTLPIPPRPHPFADDAKVLSFFALSKKKVTSTDISRKLSTSFSIQLAESVLIGGICFAGFPYLYNSREKIKKSEENSSNFGLPREVRLTCLGASIADETGASNSFEFLDAEISATRQEIISDSGFNFLCVDPTLTNFLTVHFSDYPKIFKSIKFDTNKKKFITEEYYGFIIPYFYIFEYKEKTRYRPHVSAGLLSSKSTNRVSPSNINFNYGFIDYKHTEKEPAGTNGNYFDFTSASVFGQQRDYIIRDEIYTGGKSKGNIKTRMTECFISQKIRPDKNVTLYIEQGEEYERCVAGLKIYLPFVPETALKQDVDKIVQLMQEFFPGIPFIADEIENTPREDLEDFLRTVLKIPRQIDFCENVGLRIFEIDPAEGISPISVPLDSKYATLLAEMEIDRLSEITLAIFLEGIKFVRPSNSRYFAVELTNLDNKPGQIVVKKLKLIQSAHVSIHPRAAKSQQIQNLNFRIIGADLAEDYALLGDEGFNFSIERLVAGERKSVLFRANSILDLLHTGAARIFNNVRRRAVEFEKSEVYPTYENDFIKYLVQGEYEIDGGYSFGPNYEERYTESRIEGWRRSETGHEVAGKTNWIGRKKPSSFKNINNAETRTHVELLSPQESVNEWKSNAFIGNAIYQIRQGPISQAKQAFENNGNLPFLGPNQILVPTYKNVRLYSGFGSVWKGIIDSNAQTNSSKHKNTLMIKGIKSVTSSPFGVNALTAEFFDFLDAITQLDPQNLTDPTNMVNVLSEAGDFAQLLGAAAFTQGKIFGLSAANSLSVGLNIQPVGIGVSFSASTSGGLLLPSYTYVNSFGTQGSITKQANRTGYAYSQFLNNSYDEGDNLTQIKAGEMKRIVTRKEVPKTDKHRIKGGEVMWQGELVDIITGTIPLNLALPATSTKIHFRTSDDSIRVRFGSGVGKSVAVDFWFDITEEIVRDDY